MQAVRLGRSGTSRTGREVSHEYIQRVFVQQQSAYVEYIACGAGISPKPAYRKALAGKRFEMTAPIEQGDIDAAFVGRLRHYVSVPDFPQCGVAGEVAHYTVVFHFTQGYECGRRPTAHGDDDAGYVVQLFLILGIVPAAQGIGQELMVVFQRVVSEVEEVFHVVAHHTENETVLFLLPVHDNVQAEKKDSYPYHLINRHHKLSCHSSPFLQAHALRYPADVSRIYRR